jgi:inward rectifier potassium channel
VAVVAPYEGVPSLMFRMANARGNQIVEARLRVTLVVNETTAEGHAVRRLHDLALVRSEHGAFSLSWTAVHPIDGRSPLRGRDAAWLAEAQGDIIVSLTGVDEGLAQSIHARHGYGPGDVVWNARFADILDARQLRTVVDFSRFHDTVPLADAAPESRRPPHPDPLPRPAGERESTS